MKRLLLLAVPVVLLLAAEPADEAKKELEKLQGEWVMAALEVDGKAVPEEKLQGTTLTIKGDKYTVSVKDSKHEVTIKLDPSQKLKHIDMLFPNGTDLPKVGKGIYKLDGDDKMTFCFKPEGDRPTKYEMIGYEQIVVELTRAKD